MALFTMKLSDEEKEKLQSKANGKPLGTYIKSIVLGEGGDDSFARESSDGKAVFTLNEPDDEHYIREIEEKFGSLEKFLWALAKKGDWETPQKLYKWLLAEDAGLEHPYRGYTVLLIDPGMNRAHLVSESGQDLFISDERENAHLLKWLVGDDGEPLYAEKEVIGRCVK